MGESVRKRNVTLPRRRVNDRNAANDSPPSIGIWRESVAVVLLFLGVFLGLALYSHCAQSNIFGGVWGLGSSIESEVVAGNLMGKIGEVIASALVYALGWCSFLLVLWAFLLSRRVWAVGWPETSGSLFSTVFSLVGSMLMVSMAGTFVTVLVGEEGGGVLGGFIAHYLVKYFSQAGALLLSFAGFVLSLGISTGLGAEKLLSSAMKFFGVSFSFLWRACCSGANTFAPIVKGLFGGIYQVGQLVIRATRSTVFSFFRAVFYPFRVLCKLFAGAGRVSKSKDVLHESDEASERNFTLNGEEREVLSKRELRDVNLELGVPYEVEGGERKIVRSKEEAKERRSRVFGKKKTAMPSRESESPSTASEYKLPSLKLLVSSSSDEGEVPRDEELIKNSDLLEKTLRDFRIGGKVVEVQPGPVITLYQFVPAAGVKVQRIIALADDIALALKVASVRVYAPVPGAGTVGIEVPNSYREMVRLRDVLASGEFQENHSSLALALGKDTFGDPFVGDLAKMPHLLIAGATGAGKSVCINSLLLSLLYKNTPETLQLILIDPKMLELSLYDDIPHLKAPVVTNAKRARGVLWWAVEEMERRYAVMKELGVRNLAGYNRLMVESYLKKAEESSTAKSPVVIELLEKDVVATDVEQAGLMRSGARVDGDTQAVSAASSGQMPKIVIVIDELADLMLTVGREIEELLTRLAQKARAAGIHIIIATQRPSVNVITGLIKANFPARIAFKVVSRIDSRTILDCSGADKLLGNGDMLFLSAGAGRLKRLHSAFVSDEEVQAVVESLRRQGPPKYDPEIDSMLKAMEDSEGGSSLDGEVFNEYDPLYDSAVQLVVERGQASTSMVQRAFRIGYNRAARILEVMEKEGIVGPGEGAKPRQVYMPDRDRDKV